jgi:tRNA pseudouridine55 synthase
MKKPTRAINGVLLLDKDCGASSNRVLQQAKRLYQAAKAGHTGSLDPLASGVLPICFGEATKFARFLLDADKTYLVTAKLGVITDSGDAEGQVLATNPVPEFTPDSIKAAIETFTGAGKQVPSMFSALKHNGQPLYKLARQNITIERPARDIFVYSYKLLSMTADTITCEIACSKGTYIRSLIEDLGQVLGCGAHVTMLRRTKAGPFAIENSHTLAGLEQASDIDKLLLPIDCLLGGLQKVVVSNSDAQLIRNGREIANSNPEFDTKIVALLTNENELLGIAEARNEGNIVPLRLVATQLTVI